MVRVKMRLNIINVILLLKRELDWSKVAIILSLLIYSMLCLIRFCSLASQYKWSVQVRLKWHECNTKTAAIVIIIIIVSILEIGYLIKTCLCKFGIKGIFLLSKA